MTELVNTSIGRSVNITKSHTIKAGMNINQTESITILWGFAIHTDRKIDANKADITIKDHKTTPVY